MFQRGSAGRSRLHDYGDRDLVDVARSVFWHARVVEVPPARFGLQNLTPRPFEHRRQDEEGWMGR